MVVVNIQITAALKVFKMKIFRHNEDNNAIANNNLQRVETSVKWYNPAKGYGFLLLEDNVTDVMIHFSTLDLIKCAYIKVGDRVICDIVSGKSGLYVVQVIEIKFGSPEPRSLSNFYNSRYPSKVLGNLEEIKGTVKWYNPDKGFGFIIPEEGTRDIFVHFSVVRQIGCGSLQPGTRVLAQVSQSERGPEAYMIRILCEENNGEEEKESERGIVDMAS